MSIAEEPQSFRRLKLVKFYDDLPMFDLGAFNKSKVLAVKQLQLSPGDVILAGYVKSGTTWMQYIIQGILSSGTEPKPVHAYWNEFPGPEMVGTDVLKGRPHPWTLRIHLPFQYTPYHPEAKYIYVARNPKDLCVSCYHFYQQFQIFPQNFTFSEFMENYLEDNIPYGSQFDHILSWYEHRNDPNFLFITYEEMKQDPRKAVLRVAKLLGPDHESKLLENEDMLNQIVRQTSFDNMKKMPFICPSNETGEIPTDEAIKANPNKFIQFDFFRKGMVGDWKNHLSADHSKRIDELVEKKLKHTYLYDMWKGI